MKKICLLIVTTCLLVGSAYTQSIEMTYNFDHPEYITNDEGYTELIFHGSPNYNKEGDPLIPHFGCEVLLPVGTSVDNIEIVSAEYSKVIDNIKIKPASKEFPISVGAPKDYKVKPNPEIYNSDKPYPGNIILNKNTQFLCGHSIGLFTICPLKYIPAENSIQILKSITVNISFTKDAKAENASAFLRTNTQIKSRLNSIIDNPDELDKYTYTNYRDNDENDILLITDKSLIDYFNDYVSFKESTGFIVDVVATEDIYNDYSGADEQEKIRECIIDYYQNYETSYVILGGDSDPVNSDEDLIPHRGFYCEGEYDIPSDMYYSCLDGSWNDDGDNRWGEVGEYDIYSEVVIGRICVNDSTEISNATNKLELYQNEPVTDDIEKALMVGEILNDSPLTWGGTYKDEVADGSSNHGITTTGVSDNFTISYLYDRDGNWGRNDIYDQFNNTGVNLLNHLGHSNVTYNMKMYNDHLTTTNFQNDGINRGYVIGYSQGCYNGSFDNRKSNGGYTEDSFAEKFQALETGEVACIANSRYGWYSPGNTNSSSQFHDRQFYDAIFGEDITEIGKVNSDAQGDNAPYMDGWSLMRWVVYEANLFGDPSMDIWTAQPTDIVATYPPSIPLGSSQITIQTDAAHARVGCTQNDSLIGRGITDEDGDIILNFFSPVAQTDIIKLSIIAHNRNRLMDSIYVVDDEPFVIYDDHLVDDSSDNCNGYLDYGESAYLTIDMKNVGNKPASNVDVTISTTDSCVVLTDTTESYGDFDPEEIKSVPDGFALDVKNFIPDDHTVMIKIEAEGDTSWISYLNTNVYAPVLSSASIMVDDTLNGNANGKMDPGETVDVYIQSLNIGHSTAVETNAFLSTTSDYITILDSEYLLDTLKPDSVKEAIFTLEISEDMQYGSFADFNYQLISGPYEYENTYSCKVGYVIEDWESGDFSIFDWVHAGSAHWTICENDPFEGAYCARSGEIHNNETSRIMMLVDVMNDDSISFYRKVSSEPEYDFLEFYIDAKIVGSWAGEQDWERVAFQVLEGEHLFQWEYDKDQYVSNGDDCAWLDYISLPSSETYFVGVDNFIANENNHSLNVFPNPFSDRIFVVLNLEEASGVIAEVYDINGRKIKSLANKELNPGTHKFEWYGRNDNGHKVNTGIYFLKVITNNDSFTEKIMLSY